MRKLPILLVMLAWTTRVVAAETNIDESKLLAETESRIRLNRTAPLTIEVRDAQGRAVSGAPVRVEHMRHRFFFGAGFDTQLLPRPNETDVDRRHREYFLRLFNYATVHLYWSGYEPQRGEYQDSARRQCVDWLKDHGLVARGHPIFWNHRAGVPPWVSALDPAPEALTSLLDTRLEQLSRTVLPGLRDVDVFNELTRWERFTNVFTRYVQAQGKMAVVVRYLKETKRLDALINQTWRTRGEFATDAAGKLVVPGAYEGHYRVSVGGQNQPGEHGKTHPLRLAFAVP